MDFTAEKERLEILHVRKKRCDKFYDYGMAAMLVFLITESLIYYPMYITQLGLGKWVGIVSIAVDIALRICSFLGVIRRNWKLTAASVVLIAAAMVLQQATSIYLATLIEQCVLLWNHRNWEALKKEDGFPQFEPDIRTEEHRREDFRPELSVRKEPAASPVQTQNVPIIRRGGPEDMDTI